MRELASNAFDEGSRIEGGVGHIHIFTTWCAILFGAGFLTSGLPAGHAHAQSLLADGSAVAETDDPFPAYSISGQITGVFEHYRRSGDETQAAYSFLGDHPYVELSAFGQAQLSRYERVQAQVFGVYSKSLYRNVDYSEIIIERATAKWEKGDGIIPFRAEAGDFFGNLSLRTLQRSLKGGQIEIQPQFPNPQIKSSLVLFSGQPDSIYRGIEFGEEVYAGASYLISSPLGDLSLNAVHNYRESDDLTTAPRRDQTIYSVAGETQIDVANQALTFEFEAAQFNGAYGTSGTSLVEGKKDYGLFTELSGRSRAVPLTYSVLFERYGQDFRPRGGSVSADRETKEARAGYRLPNGLLVKGRLQQFKDALESDNPSTTNTAGLDLIGPFNVGGWPWSSLTGSIISFISETENRDKTSRSRTTSISPNFSSQVSDTITANWGGFYTSTNNLVTKVVTRSADLFAGFDWSFQLDRFVGRIAPAVTARRSWSPTSNIYDYGPTIGFDLSGDGHNFSADYAVLIQDGRKLGLTDNLSHNVSATYNYTYGNHTFGLEGDYIHRDTDPGTETKSYRAALTYSLRFSAPQAQAPTTPDGALAPVAGQLRLADLPPGLLLSTAIQRLEDEGFGSGVSRSGIVIYEVNWLSRIDQRQRLVLQHDGQRLTRTALLVSFEDVGDGDSSEQLFDRVRDALIRRYGAPATFEEGDFTANLIGDVNTDRLIRLNEWSLSEGVLRMGIPRRLDRQVQIEVQFARGFSGPAQTRWAVNQVR